MVLGAIGEWIIGNTFPFVVFGTFGACKKPHVDLHQPFMLLIPKNLEANDYSGAFWLSFGATLIPSFNAYGAYVTNPEQAASQMGNPGNPLGLQQPAFNSSFAFFLLFMGAFPPPLPTQAPIS